MARTDTETGPPGGRRAAGEVHRWWTLGLVCVSIFMLLLDITVVNVALPTIRHDLHATFTDLQWVIDAYALALAVLVLNAGALSDILGRKRIFMAGLALFALSSLACGLAPSSEVLIVFRGVQGIGGAIMFSTSLALINHAFPPKERGTAFGIWGATTGLAVAIGPLVGGALTTSAGWRWIFFINVPIGAVAAMLSTVRLTESKDPRDRRIDWPGLFTLSGALALLVYALLRGNSKGWSSPLIVVFFIGAAVLLGVFVAIQARSPRSMVDLRLFRIPAFTGAQLVAFAISASMFSMFLYLTLYLQNVLGFSALGAGLRLMPVSILIFVFAPIAGRLSSVLPVRLLMGAGLVLIAVGLLFMSGLTPQSTWTALLAGFVLAGAGVGLVNAPLASTAVAVAPGRQAGMAAGLNNTFRQVGIAHRDRRARRDLPEPRAVGRDGGAGRYPRRSASRGHRAGRVVRVRLAGGGQAPGAAQGADGRAGPDGVRGRAERHLRGRGRRRVRRCRGVGRDGPGQGLPPHGRARRGDGLRLEESDPSATMSELRLAELVGAMSIATDIGLGAPLEAGLSVCLMSMRLGEVMGLSDQELGRAYVLALLRHIGCTADSDEMAAMGGDEFAMNMAIAPLDHADPRQVMPRMLRHLAREFPGVRFPPAVLRMLAMAPKMRTHDVARCEVAEMLAERMGFDRQVQQDVRLFNERWDGKGAAGLKGEAIPRPVQAVQVAEGATILRHTGGDASVPEIVRRRARTMYGPDAAEAFLRDPDAVLSATAVPSVWDAAMEAEPEPRVALPPERLDGALRAVAEFSDLKSSYLVGHSTGVADLARAAAERAALPVTDVQDVHRAALAHDVGRVGVSATIWNRKGSLSFDQWEKVRMHPYYTDRVLARPEALRRLAWVASMHHERMDSSGYFRRVPGAQQPSGARLLAAADAFHAMLEPRPHRQALARERAAEELRADVRAGRLDGDAVEAVLQAAGQPVRRRREHVASLTAREVEVLRLVARGLSIKEIARALTIAPKTADAHLQHIYTKAGVSTRAAATLFAMEHDLVGPLAG
jgi:EmrB/QacA subfamily drug resistance transporter